MSNKPTVKIMISCHKEINYPKCDSYLPVHVGAAGKKPLPNMQPDSSGDNISDRNFTYCELSAQYWGWKHLDADYIGQCHYRRYFYFGDQKYKANDHGQIEVECLSPSSLSKYELEDDRLVLDALDGCDGVIAPVWNVGKTITPSGRKKTVRDHMVGYGLVSYDDFDRLVSIVDELQPEYARELRDYLDGPVYRGYNCFILKRNLFQSLSEFEFPVLRRFDESFDYSGLTTTRKRICGYMGEVLYSVFILHAQSQGHSFVEKPLLFFDETPAPYSGHDVADEYDTHIVWRYEDPCAARLSVAADSLVVHLNPKKTYHLTIVHDSDFKFTEFMRFLSSVPSNLTVDDAVFPVFECLRSYNDLNEEEQRALLPLLLLQSAKTQETNRFIWIDGLALFDGDVDGLFIDANNVAMEGVLLERELNRPEYAALSSVYGAIAGRSYHDSSIIIINAVDSLPDGREVVNKYREVSARLNINLPHIMKRARRDFEQAKDCFGTSRDQFAPPVEYWALMSALLDALAIGNTALKTAAPALDRVETTTWASEETALAWRTVDPVVRSYKAEAEPLTSLSVETSLPYWGYARMSSAYEVLLALACENRTRKPRLRNRILPPFSRRRRALGKIKALLLRR